MSDLTPPPHAEGAEKSILSSMLQDSVEYLPRAIEMGITPERFYVPAHSRFFKILLEKHVKGEVIELTALSQELVDSDQMDSLGGPSAIAEFYSYAPNGAHFDSHAKIVLEKHQLRSVIKFGTKITSQAYENERIEALIPQIELGALTIGKDAEGKSGYNYGLKCAYRELLAVLESEEAEGIPTGWAGIDAVTGGLHPGEVTVIGARPAMGKTAFAISLADNLALHAGVPTALFAVEGKRTYLTTRLMAMTAHISAKRIRDKQISKGDITKIKRRMGETKDSPLRIDDRISNAVEIAAKIRRMHQQSPLKVVIIDYIQKLPAALPDERSNLRLRIINATDVLHQTCKTLDIALVLLAQLGRESKDDNPDINALKESGSLEQDGDTVILLGKKGEDPEDVNAPREKLIRIAKNRHGPCCDLALEFNPPTTRFY
jgi:replicative DNA helicase